MVHKNYLNIYIIVEQFYILRVLYKTVMRHFVKCLQAFE